MSIGVREQAGERIVEGTRIFETSEEARLWLACP